MGAATTGTVKPHRSVSQVRTTAPSRCLAHDAIHTFVKPRSESPDVGGPANCDVGADAEGTLRGTAPTIPSVATVPHVISSEEIRSVVTEVLGHEIGRVTRLPGSVANQDFVIEYANQPRLSS
jgi:hypothetical protein